MTSPTVLNLAAHRHNYAMPLLLVVGKDPNETAIWIATLILFAVIFGGILRDYERRAKSHDHVAEVDRDVAIPDHCVSCGRPHAPIRLEALHLFLGVSPIDKIVNADMKRKYLFHYCLACARPVVRRRKLGKAMIAVGALFFVHLALFFTAAMVLPRGTFFNAGFLASVNMLLVDIVGGSALMMAGWVITKYSPNVRIVDRGTDTIYFRFTNQVFRNHFAELNGAS
jgi:hypothetical protein